MPHHHRRPSPSSSCACKDSKPKHKRRASAHIKWMGNKVKELRKSHPGKPFGWYGKEAGRLYRIKFKGASDTKKKTHKKH